MVYDWKNWGHVRGVSAQVAGETCAKLEEEGRLNAQTLVDESRPEDAPLHPAFTWDDSEAAEEWRRHEARNIINCITVTIEKPAENRLIEVAPENVVTRAFFNIDRGSACYESVTRILSDEEKREMLYKTALSELTAFRKKYAELREFDTVFEQIEKLESMGKVV